MIRIWYHMLVGMEKPFLHSFVVDYPDWLSSIASYEKHGLTQLLRLIGAESELT
jgi:hypothetical protein